MMEPFGPEAHYTGWDEAVGLFGHLMRGGEPAPLLPARDYARTRRGRFRRDRSGVLTVLRHECSLYSAVYLRDRWPGIRCGSSNWHRRQ
jgi:hypothetical protein